MALTTFSWEEARAELARRRAAAKEHGGPEAVARQRAAGRGLVRERIDGLVDPGSFTEVGTLAVVHERGPDGEVTGKRPAGYVMGLARVDGRPVAVGGDDFTIHGGAVTGYLDRVKGGFGGFVEELAREYRIPLLLMVESIGGDVAINDRKGYPPLVSSISLETSFSLLAQVPVIAVIMGASAGAAPARAVMTHFSLMTERTAFAVTAGPPVVRRALGVEIDKFELGGAQVHTRNGTIDNPAADESDAFVQMRRMLSYLPQNVWEMAPFVANDDPPERLVEELWTIAPENLRRGANPHRVINAIFDRGTFFEIGPNWGRSYVTGLARIGGYPVGVICGNPLHLGGAIDALSADKQARMIDLCDVFHLPIVNLVDVPGVMIGPEAEKASAIRHATRALQALYQSSVPVVTVQMRKAYGLAALTSSNPKHLGLRFAWPGTEFGDLPIEGGVEAAYRRVIAAAEDPAAKRKEIEDRMRAGASTWKTAEHFALEEMIDPAETRRYIFRFIEASQGSIRLQLGPRYRAGMRV